MNLDRILQDLKAERARLDSAIAALEGGHASTGARRGGRRRTRHLTPEGRKRLSEMMKKRWAERRKKAKSA